MTRAMAGTSATQREAGHAARFIAVGGSGYVVNLGVFAGLFTLGVMPLVCSVAAFCVALCSNFVLNRHWTFRASGQNAGGQMLRYALANGAGLGVNLAVLAVALSSGVDPIVGQVVGIGCAAPVSFALSRMWAFRPAMTA